MEYRRLVQNRLISTSIYAADLLDLRTAVSKVPAEGGNWIHIDVMDGHFVTPINFGTKIVEGIKSFSDLPLDVHLMVDTPSRFLELFIGAGADWLTFHYEAESNCEEKLIFIRKAGVHSGLAISPETPVESILPLLHVCDLVLVMTKSPGNDNSPFQLEALEKVKSLRYHRQEQKQDFLISVDGGIDVNAVEDIRDADPDVVVMGSAFFGSEDPLRTVTLFARNDTI